MMLDVPNRRRKLVVRWSMTFAALIALFWALWWYFSGTVPTLKSIQITAERAVILPFAISRWWNILLAPLYFSAIILLFTAEIGKKNEYYLNAIGSGIVLAIFPLFFTLLTLGDLPKLMSFFVFNLVVIVSTVFAGYILAFCHRDLRKKPSLCFLFFSSSTALNVFFFYGLLLGIVQGIFFGFVALAAGLVFFLLFEALRRIFTLDNFCAVVAFYLGMRKNGAPLQPATPAS